MLVIRQTFNCNSFDIFTDITLHYIDKRINLTGDLQNSNDNLTIIGRMK